MSSEPRFHVGDRVRVIRQGPQNNLVGVVREVDTSRLAVHYIVEFNGIHQQRFPEFDLGPARIESPQTV